MPILPLPRLYPGPSSAHAPLVCSAREEAPSAPQEATPSSEVPAATGQPLQVHLLLPAPVSVDAHAVFCRPACLCPRRLSPADHPTSMSACRGKKGHLLAFVPGAAKTYCTGKGFVSAGTTRSFTLPAVFAKQASQWKTFNPAASAVCTGANCPAFSIIECVPTGAAACKTDAQGNIGHGNTGGAGRVVAPGMPAWGVAGMLASTPHPDPTTLQVLATLAPTTRATCCTETTTLGERSKKFRVRKRSASPCVTYPN